MGRFASAWAALTGQRRDLASDEMLGWRNRSRTGSTVHVTHDTALRNSAVWACLRLRADMISTAPVDTYRITEGRHAEVPKPALLEEPYPGIDITEHFYSSQIDLDRYGNSVGVVRSRNQLGQPLSVELAPMGEVTARCKGYTVDHWKICGEKYTPDQIWHERQYTVGGFTLGLSPIAYAAWSIGAYLSAQDFVLQWFGGGAMPSGVLRNTERSGIPRPVLEAAKASFKASTENRDIFATGKEWEWLPAAVDASTAGFLQERQYGVSDVCRFLGVPGDMIDAPTSGSSITYANVTQRNVQLLVTNLGPVFVRRERHWSRHALSAPRFMKFNTDAILRMDPEARERVILSRVAGRVLAPSEARALDNLPPFTAEQLAEFAQLAPVKQPNPAAQAGAQWEVPA